jgi:RNA polymerase sigma-70 factor (ECF subfamily)
MSDVDRFEAFVLRFQDMVYATAFRLLGRPADAEDVAQTVFLRAFERFDQIADSPAAPGWLKTVTTNLCLNHLSRHRARWRLFSELTREDDEGESSSFESTIAADVPVDGLDEADARQALEEALGRLPEHQRVPLVLYHYEEKSYQEIASLLGVSLGKVKTDIHRGREALKTYVVPHE